MSGQPEELNELKDITISALYNGEYNSHSITYEIPIYQRNYAWGEEEISALIQDVYHAFSSHKKTPSKNANYYLGTLVSFCKDEKNKVYEVIDGQQRLTTIFLILKWLSHRAADSAAPQASPAVECTNRLRYQARRKANNAIDSIDETIELLRKEEEKEKEKEEKKKKVKPINSDDLDKGITNGLCHVRDSLKEISEDDWNNFVDYFQNKVHIIHYQVPKDIDLNHYFEIMNSRGEQLEMSEVLKARLMEKLNDADKAKFSLLWECCSEMNVYVQQKYAKKTTEEQFTKIFDLKEKADFKIKPFDPDRAPSKLPFDDLPDVSNSSRESSPINDLLKEKEEKKEKEKEKGTGDGDNAFQPLMDFANFLLIVLKLTVKLEKIDLDAKTIVLHDKELLNQFGRIQFNEDFVKKFGYNLLKARFFLDNYIVHHSCEEDTAANNPWKLQYWKKEKQESYCVNLDSGDAQMQLVHLLSMFEVAFPPRQRKNYLFYCLLYLFEKHIQNNSIQLEDFRAFLSKLADKYFWDVYMKKDGGNLNNNNVPLPGSFDNEILTSDDDQIPLLNLELENKPDGFNKFREQFAGIYGGKPDDDETTEGEISKGIPLFIFNYLDYKIWKKYSDLLREGKKPNDFFPNKFGCTADADSDLIQKSFKQFYFPRTRRSLEHYFPQANVNEEMTENQINCFGNFAMIGEEANSAGSNRDPSSKLKIYLKNPLKIPQVSVASLKFLIMMQICKEEGWTAEKINEHQQKMLEILLDRS